MYRRMLLVIVIINLLQGTYHQNSAWSKQKIMELFDETTTSTESSSAIRLVQKIKEVFGDLTTSTETSSALPLAATTEVPCDCVPFYVCTNDSKIDTSGSFILDLRTDECDNYMMKCCSLPGITKNPEIPEPAPQTECGKRNPQGVGFRITGDSDNEAQFGEFPWMVAVLYERDNDGEIIEIYLCGGALIHPQAILTAAHCVVDKKKKFLVRAGEWDTQTTTEIFPHQNRYVKSITIHHDYYSGALHNDIAFVVLTTPFKLTGHIDVLCLPSQDITIPSGTRCFASGWGTDVYGQNGKYQVILKKVELPIVGRDECQQNLRTTRLGPRFELDKSFVCAGGELGLDTCNGDGGSPLVCPIPGKLDRYQHVGLVSWGVDCGKDQIPGLYANVPLFRKWVDVQMQINNLDSKSYMY